MSVDDRDTNLLRAYKGCLSTDHLKGFYLLYVGYSVAGSYICEGNDVSHTFRCPFGRTGISKLWPLCHRSGDGAEMPLIPKSLLLGNNPQSQIIREMVLGIN